MRYKNTYNLLNINSDYKQIKAVANLYKIMHCNSKVHLFYFIIKLSNIQPKTSFKYMIHVVMNMMSCNICESCTLHSVTLNVAFKSDRINI